MRRTHDPLPALRRRHREDGWTPEVQRDFIEALSECGSVALACEQVGRSASSAYKLRARPDAQAFRTAWQAATDLAYRQLHELAMDRIVNGVEAPMLYKGQHCYQRTVYSDRLLMFMLEHLRPDRNARADETVTRVPDDSAQQGVALALEALETANAPVLAAREKALRLQRRRTQRLLARRDREAASAST